MANDTFTNTATVILTNAALEAFTAVLQPLTSFATDFSAAAAQRGNAVRVLFIPSQVAAQNFTGSYASLGETATGIDVTISQHKFVSWSLTDVELAVNNLLKIEQFGRQFGFNLGKAVLQDIWSLLVLSNYNSGSVSGTAGSGFVFVGSANTFDSDNIVDIKSAVDALYWPEFGRKIVLSPTYYNGLLQDTTVKLASAIGVIGSTTPAQSGKLPSLSGFEIDASAVIPANGQNVQGFVCLPDCMAVAMRYLQPQPGNTYLSAFAVTNEAGFTLGFRDYYNNDGGYRTQALEANYGYSAVNPNALQLIASV